MSIPADKDGDTIMADVTKSPSTLTSPFREKFNFDWFSFDARASTSPRSPRSAGFPPVTPSSQFSPASDSSLSPVSPATPTPILATATPRRRSAAKLPSPPPEPLAWVWQCHQCKSRYPLAVTRRCLIDGHFYCSGESQTTTSTATKNLKRRKKAASCTSEFDYVGWANWGTYRRKCMALRAYATLGRNAEVTLVGCTGCSFPSQCRYENRPRVESINLRKYVGKSDVDDDDDEETEEAIKTSKGTTMCNDKKSSNQNGKLETGKLGGSFGQRFYSSITGNFSSSELKTGPTMERSTSSATRNRRAKSATETEQPLSSGNEQKKVRVNSKIDDPSYEEHEKSTTSPSGDLHRSGSSQSLLTEFFRHAKSVGGSVDSKGVNSSTATSSLGDGKSCSLSTPDLKLITSRSDVHEKSAKWSRPQPPVPPGLVLQGKDLETIPFTRETNVAGGSASSSSSLTSHSGSSTSTGGSGNGMGYALGGFGYREKE